MALTESQNASRQAWVPLADLTGHIRHWLKDPGDRLIAQKIADREIAEAGFFPLDRLPDNTTPATLRRLSEVFDGAAVSPYW